MEKVNRIIREIMGSSKREGKEKCEDIVGGNKGFYWLLDGATGTGSNDDVSKYVSDLSDALYEYSEYINSSLDLLMKAIEKVGDSKENICSTIALVYVRDKYIEYTIVGDSHVGIRVNNIKYSRTDDRLKYVATKERYELSKVKDENSCVYKELRDKLLKRELEYRNKKDGYWVINGDKNVRNHVLQGRVNISDGDSADVIIMSDGMERLVSVFKEYNNLCDICVDILEYGFEGVIDKLRSLEDRYWDDIYCEDFVSKHDDASVIYLQLRR